jgi:hypothetical protein
MTELVGLQGHSPDVLGKLSQLLQIRGQRAQVSQEEQNARQRAGIAKYDWNKHIGPDGTIDVESVSADPELAGIAGDSYIDLMSHVAQAKQAQLSQKSTLLNLRTEQRKQFSDLMTALRSDKDVAEDSDAGRRKVNDEMIRFGQLYGDDALPVLEAYAPGLQKVPKGRMSDALRAIGLQAADADRQVEMQKPQYASRGDVLTNVNPLAPMGSAPDIAMGIAPGFHVVVDPRTNNPYLLNSQTGETRDLGQGYPGGAHQDMPPTTPIVPRPRAASSIPAPFYPGQDKDIATNQAEVATTREQASAAPQNRNIYQNILRLTDETATGPLVSYLQGTKIGGQVFGDNYQELGKYLEKNAVAQMQAMGAPHSNAGLEAAAAASGSTKFNAKALKAVTQFNYATNTALEQYRAGMDKAVGLGNPDYTKLPQFKAAWAKNFDIDVFKLENAIADGDQKQVDAILGGLSPAKREELAKKRENLMSLQMTGALPQ